MRFNERFKACMTVLLAATLGAAAIMILYATFLVAIGISMAHIKGVM